VNHAFIKKATITIAARIQRTGAGGNQSHNRKTKESGMKDRKKARKIWAGERQQETERETEKKEDEEANCDLN
jgi:hypothetical protein